MRKKFKAIFNKFSNNSFIEITDITKTNNKIDIKFKFSPDLKEFLKEKHHRIEYLKLDYDVCDCPNSICVIPAVSNLLPLVWFFDVKLIVNELDKTFYESIDDIKRGFQHLFPFIKFKGKVIVNSLVDNEYEPEDNSVVLFSHGIDSLNTFVNHENENLHLTTIHGSDIPLSKVEGLNNLSKMMDEFASKYGCENSFIRSNFRRYLNYPNLNEELPMNMKRNWWHQFQHGIGILSHAVIIAYGKKSKYIYMASTHSQDIANFLDVDYVPCASSPLIDNNFRFASCSVIHDGYEYKRLDKLKNIIEFSKNNGPVNLRVCFISNDGNNCSSCEKCSRSIFGLASEGENPNEYGFEVYDDKYIEVKENLDSLRDGNEKRGWRKQDYRSYYWINIQNNFRENYKKEDFGENINWIFDYEFFD